MVGFEKKNMKDEEAKFRMGLNAKSEKFIIQKGDPKSFPLLTLSPQELQLNTDLLVKQDFKLGLRAQLKYNDIGQWIMVHEEANGMFDLTKWSLVGDTKGQILKVTQCGPTQMIGGFGELST